MENLPKIEEVFYSKLNGFIEPVKCTVLYVLPSIYDHQKLIIYKYYKRFWREGLFCYNEQTKVRIHKNKKDV